MSILSQLFSCKHPAGRLMVEKSETIEQSDADFDHVTYHFICGRCYQPVKVKHARCRGGVEAFLQRGKTEKLAV